MSAKNELAKAIQEFEDEAYHHSMHPEISNEAKAIALRAMLDKQKLLQAGMSIDLALEIARAAGHLHDELFCPVCGDAYDIELVNGELAVGCFGCDKYKTIKELVMADMNRKP